MGSSISHYDLEQFKLKTGDNKSTLRGREGILPKPRYPC